MAKLIVKKVRSTIKKSQTQKRTMEALGLRKMNSTREHEDNPVIRGMIRKVAHLVEVREA